jgi:hypothetical protein
VLLAWALLSLLTSAPYLRAWLAPPPGTAFLGFFYFVDDQYNYFSYVQQAERGAFFFQNALLLEPHPPRLVNLEWWLVGRLSAALGGRPFLAWRLLALAGALLLLAGLDRWLRSVGLPETHRLPALMLVGLGGGLGGIAWRAGIVPLPEAIDLTTGLFPFLELLANPHFVVGTALLVWSLRAFSRATTWRDHALAATLGTVLGLVRPYDVVLLGGARGLAVLATEPAGRWRSRLLPLLGLVPVTAYLGWVFYAARWFGSSNLDYAFPPPGSFVLALAPAMGLALLVRPPAAHDEVRAARVHLLAWIVVVALVLVLRPVGFPLQFMAGLGAPLLVLVAVGLARFSPRVSLLATALLSSTALAALGLVSSDNPRWYVPPERLDAAWALKASCRPGDRAFAPPDIGLYVAGLSACTPYVSHAFAPDHEARAEAVRQFYEASPPAARAAFLDRLCITHLALPGDAGDVPEAWLGAGTPFRRTALVGHDPRRIGLYARADRARCVPRDLRASGAER